MAPIKIIICVQSRQLGGSGEVSAVQREESKKCCHRGESVLCFTNSLQVSPGQRMVPRWTGTIAGRVDSQGVAEMTPLHASCCLLLAINYNASPGMLAGVKQRFVRVVKLRRCRRVCSEQRELSRASSLHKHCGEFRMHLPIRIHRRWTLLSG